VYALARYQGRNARLGPMARAWRSQQVHGPERVELRHRELALELPSSFEHARVYAACSVHAVEGIDHPMVQDRPAARILLPNPLRNEPALARLLVHRRFSGRGP
jgi:hypothetical protein